MIHLMEPDQKYEGGMLTGFYQKAKILCVLLSHELLSTKYITHQFTYFTPMFYSHQDKLKNSRITRIHYIKSYQQNKIVFLDELVFYLYFI